MGEPSAKTCATFNACLKDVLQERREKLNSENAGASKYDSADAMVLAMLLPTYLILTDSLLLSSLLAVWRTSYGSMANASHGIDCDGAHAPRLRTHHC